MPSLKSKWKKFRDNYFRPFLELEPEWNYKAGIILNDLLAKNPYQNNSSSLFSISNNATIGVVVGWNYLDGLWAMMNGVMQLLDEDDYRRTAMKVKGVANILSGAQLFAFSYNQPLSAVMGVAGGATAFAGPAFAAATLADLVNASIDFHYANKEVTFEGWLDERLCELDFVDEQLRAEERAYKNEKKKLTKGDKARGDQSYDNNNKIDCLDEKHNKKKKKLEDKKNELLDKIGIRCRVSLSKNKAKKSHIETVFKKHKRNELICLDDPLKGDDVLKDEKIQDDLDKAYKETRINLVFKTLSFVGMTCLAISPFISAACPPASAIVHQQNPTHTNAHLTNLRMSLLY